MAGSWGHSVPHNGPGNLKTWWWGWSQGLPWWCLQRPVWRNVHTLGCPWSTSLQAFPYVSSTPQHISRKERKTGACSVEEKDVQPFLAFIESIMQVIPGCLFYIWVFILKHLMLLSCKTLSQHFLNHERKLDSNSLKKLGKEPGKHEIRVVTIFLSPLSQLLWNVPYDGSS